MKLTQRRIERIAALIRTGCYVATACARSGVSRRVYYAWKKKGQEAREQHKTNIYTDFLEAVEMADADIEVALVSEISRENSWRAKLEILKRRFPERWGDRSQVHKHDKGQSLQAYSAPVVRNVYLSSSEGS